MTSSWSFIRQLFSCLYGQKLLRYDINSKLSCFFFSSYHCHRVETHLLLLLLLSSSSSSSPLCWVFILICLRQTMSLGNTVVLISLVSVLNLLYFYISTFRSMGSSVGIATDYALDGPGSSPGGDEIFRPSRPALGRTQPPEKWAPGLYRG